MKVSCASAQQLWIVSHPIFGVKIFLNLTSLLRELRNPSFPFVKQQSGVFVRGMIKGPPPRVVEQPSAWGRNLRHLLEGKICIAKLSEDAADSGDIKLGSYDYHAMPPVGIEYSGNFKRRLISPR